MTVIRLVTSGFILMVTLAPLGRASGAEGPALSVPESTLRAALHCPETFDDTKHEPVLLVHGTYTDDHETWSWNYLPQLTSLGFDVCTVTLPEYSLGDAQVQAEYVVYGVRTMSAASGDKIDVIGSSQGSLHPRWAVRWWPDVRDVTDDIVMLAGPNHGTETSIQPFGRCFPSCWQMSPGSNYLRALNADDETPGNVSYTSIYSLFDELVVPQFPESTSALDGGRNILIQDLCPGRPSDHVAVASSDAVAYAMAYDALVHAGTADPARFDVATCAQAMMPGSDPTILFDGSGRDLDNSEFVDEEPPLKPYARSSQSPPGEEPAPTDAPANDERSPQNAPGPADEIAVGGPDVGGSGTTLPSSGTNVLGYIAIGTALVAVGSALRQPGTRSERRADRRTLPASSRSGSDTNS